MNLFIELYLDEDVDVLIADLLKAHGFVARTTRDLGQLGNTDAEQFAYAVSQNNAVLTHNRIDFVIMAKKKRIGVSLLLCVVRHMRWCRDF